MISKNELNFGKRIGFTRQNHFRLKVMVCLLFLFFGVSKFSFPQSSDLAYLKKTFFIDQDSDTWIYKHKKACASSDIIQLVDGNIRSPYAESYLYLIDDTPLANWSHPCRYVFLNKEDRNQYKVINSTSPPLNFSEFKTILSTEIPSGKTFDFTNTREKFLANKGNSLGKDLSEIGFGERYAVIISGGVNKYNNHWRYWNDCSAIYSTLRYVYGFKSENIFVLMSDGLSNGEDRRLRNGTYDDSPKDLDGDGTIDVTAAATKSKLSQLFYDLGSKITEEDYLYIFGTDHGGRGKGKDKSDLTKVADVHMCLWNNEKVTDDEFANYLFRVDPAYISVVLEQCYSGGFIDDLAYEGRVIATACRAGEPSWATSDLNYNEFVYHWTAAAKGSYPNGNIAVADSNDDGFVTMKEAFTYAKEHDSKDEIPQYHSKPANLGEELTNLGFLLNLDLRDITSPSGLLKRHYGYHVSAATEDSYFEVETDAICKVKAGKSITFHPGFTVNKGADFRAVIEPFDIPILHTGNNLKSGKNNMAVSGKDFTEIDSEALLLDNVSVYPNPSTGVFYLSNGGEGDVQVFVYNSKGEIIINNSVNSTKSLIDLSDQPSGIYILRLFQGQKTFSKKLIIE